MYPEYFYHIYNRGNNKQRIFFNDANYYFFKKKIKQYIIPSAHILSYCLMPNHFHFLVYTKMNYDEIQFKNNFRILLSSYTRGINKERNRTGSLFQQNTKFKLIDPLDDFDPNICFNYIHLNPLRAFLVNDLALWPHSSYPCYIREKSNFLVDRMNTGIILQRNMSSSAIISSTFEGNLKA